MPRDINKYPDPLRKQKQVDEIIDLLYSENGIADQTADKIRIWLADDEYDQMKEDALRRKFDEVYGFRKDSEYGPTMWPQLASRLCLEYDPFEEKKKNIDRVNTRSRKRYNAVWKVAAVFAPFLIIAAGITHFLINNEGLYENGSDSMIVISAPANCPHIVVLPDGSIVEMKAGSEISYHQQFIEDRSLYFSGEGYFKVTKSGGSTFTVHTNKLTVTVTGTEFSLNAPQQEDIARIVLTAGKVSVAGEGLAETIMEVGQKLNYDGRSQNVEVSRITVEEKLELMDINLDFNTTLDEIFRTISRYHDMEITVAEGVELDKNMVVPFVGTESIEEIMAVLKYMTGSAFDYQINQGTISITAAL